MHFGKIFVIINPMAHSGDGAQAGDFLERFLEVHRSAHSGCTVRRTQAIGHATELAKEAAGYDTVLVLGGDGVIHEVVQGLQQLEPSARPVLAVVPYGSGNDFARSLKLKANDCATAVQQLMAGNISTVDLAHVRSFDPDGALCDEQYMVQTLSFGVDALIAHETTKRRLEGAAEKGEALFLNAGLKMLKSIHQTDPYKVSFDGSPMEERRNILFAVQQGPSYGGGFKVCPDAKLDDGLLDLCYSVGKPSVVRCLALFVKMRKGKHVTSRHFESRQVKTVHIDFGTWYPTQIDGEQLKGSSFEIRCLPGALKLVLPAPLG